MCRGPAIRLPSVISVSSRRSRSGQARRSGWSFTRISSSPLREVVDMAAIKLGKLPDRTPVKLTISILPDLKQALDDYASLYSATYGEEEPVTVLIPQMLATFLASEIGRAHVCTQVTNAHLVCRILLQKK